MQLVRSLIYFVLAGILEIGGGYLIWLWLRGEKTGWLGVFGAISLAVYGIVATWQPAHFGRVYAAYGGVFIAMAMLWGWKVDGVMPDRYDWIGAGLAILGAWTMIYFPRF